MFQKASINQQYILSHLNRQLCRTGGHCVSLDCISWRSTCFRCFTM